MHEQHLVVGQRVQVSPAADAWHDGDRYGTVTKPGTWYAHVRMERTGHTRRIPTRLLIDTAPTPAFDRPPRPPCDCGCPEHDGHLNLLLASDVCACTLSCASLPMLVRIPETGSVGMLDDSGEVIAAICRTTPGRVDWRTLGPVNYSRHAEACAEAARGHLAALGDLTRAALDHDDNHTNTGPATHHTTAAPTTPPDHSWIVHVEDPAALHQMAHTASTAAGALSDLHDAWERARSDPRLDEWLCEGYPFDRDLLEVLVDALDWASRITDASRAHTTTDDVKHLPQPATTGEDPDPDPDLLLADARRRAELILADRDDGFRRDDDDAVELAETITALDRYLTGGGAAPGDWRRHVLAQFTRSDAEHCIERRLTPDEGERIARAIGHSTIPEAFDDIVAAIAD